MSKIRVKTCQEFVFELEPEDLRDLLNIGSSDFVQEIDVVHPYGCDRWAGVKSSNISGVGQEYQGRESDLVVEFKSGAAYRYPGLGNMFETLVNAPSVGKAFATHVKSAKNYKKLG